MIGQSPARSHNSDGPKPVFWVVVRRFGKNMELQGRDEFTHPDFDRTLELAGAYVKRMANNHEINKSPFSHFTIEIIRSRE